ncbi:hypothetical protein V7112_14920 [Bacillus sp. JJ1566]|uniref:hypothetical protein n=1 Tax=Bacillus sp. JJ1566 TaxID=3122961 RepID=UPI002FFD6EC9
MQNNPYGMQMPYGHDIKHTCHNLRNYYVVGHMHDGSQMEGIIEDVDDEGVTMLVPEEVEEFEMEPGRQFGSYGGYGRRRFRRFRRRRFPFNYFVFPFFFPFPFYY